MVAVAQALVIGNGAYSPNLRLASPRNDADAMARSLRDLNFEVTAGMDLSYDATMGVIEEFIRLVNEPTTTTSLFYYSGHGMQLDDQNYIIPVDFDHFADQNLTKLIRVQSILDKMSNATAVRIVLLDACRSNADARLFIGGKGIATDKAFFINNQPVPRSGLAEMKAASNTFIAFAAAPGDVAYDGRPGDPLSPFTASFVRYLDAIDLPISNLTSRVRQDVLKRTQEKQRTWDQSSLMAPFYFNPGSLLLFTGNLMALAGLILSMIPYSLILSWPKATASLVATALALPAISLAILLFGTQSVYSRLRGNFKAELEQGRTVRDHLITSLQKGVLGGYLGSSFAALLITGLYYYSWDEPTEPFGAILLEITVATALTACALGMLSLLFARVSVRKDGLKLSQNTSAQRILIGAACGGVLAGILAAPPLTVHFGLIDDRPEMTPGYLLPGSILGASIIVFSIVNFDFERLSRRRLLMSGSAAFAALGGGLVMAGLVFGPLYALGIVGTVIHWMEDNPKDVTVLAAGGAIYGIPVGFVLGVVIGLALILTQAWSRKPVLE